jgi:hypothetical protein
VLVAHTYNPSYSGGRGQEDLRFKASPGLTPYLKNTKHKKRVDKVAEVVERLPSKREATSINPSTTTTKKTRVAQMEGLFSSGWY